MSAIRQTFAAARARLAARPLLAKILRNTTWLLLGTLSRMVVGLFVSIALARYLGPVRFGVVSVATAFTGIATIVAGLGVQGIVVRELVRDRGKLREIIGSSALLLLGGGALAYLLLLAYLAGTDRFGPDEERVIATFGAAVLFKFTEVVGYWFESQTDSRPVVIAQNGVFFVFALVKLALILRQGSLLGFAVASLAETAATALVLVRLLGVRVVRLGALRYSRARMRAMLANSWPLLLSGVAVVAYMKIDQIMVGQMLGSYDAGIYGAAVRISEVWYFVPVLVTASVFPALVATRQGSEPQYLARLAALYRLMTWLAVMVSIGMTFASGWVVERLFGDGFREAGPVLAIHVWASVFVFMGVIGEKWLIIENLQRVSMQRTILGAVVNIALNLVLIPRYRSAGAAVATVVSYGVAALFGDLLDRRTRPMFRMKIRSFDLLRFSKAPA